MMTDRLHKSGFKMHATLLRHMFQLVEAGHVTLELYDVAQHPNVTVSLRSGWFLQAGMGAIPWALCLACCCKYQYYCIQLLARSLSYLSSWGGFTMITRGCFFFSSPCVADWPFDSNRPR